MLFLQALREGVRSDGANYFPVFPYPSFTGITDRDALAIKAYLFSLPPVHRENRPHHVPFPFSWRFLQAGWKLLFFSPGPFQPAPERSIVYNRGAYLVTALGALRRVPYSAQFSRRHASRPVAGRDAGWTGRSARPEYHAGPRYRDR